MSLKSQRRLAAEILKVGENRVWIDPERIDYVEAAITREEIRKLIHEKVVKPLPEKGVSRARARVLKEKRKEGLRKGPGGKSGSARSKISKKQAWMNQIRPIRKRLSELKDSRDITETVYRKLYDMSESGVFESKADLERYIRTHGLWRRR
ncbi:MAG TPA: 50S ribosomal protein L19e [Candidatus Bathyarchaeota archaeon]|nr:50S ribosomal protein L19e [Candidatus Bathyarchaeota archaeon]